MVAALTGTGGLDSRRITDLDEIDDENTDVFAPFLTSPTAREDKSHFLELITFEGGAQLQHNLRLLGPHGNPILHLYY